MDQAVRENSRYLPGLDGLRTVAILGIVLYHMFPGAVRGGYLGVTLFFALSGYLLSRTGRAAVARGGFRPGAFYQRRIRRIYPALLWVVALTLLALRLWLPEALTGVRQELRSVLLGYQNWRQILQSQDYFTRITATTPFTHMWSLAVELQFYLVWPLLFGLYRLEIKEGDAGATIGVLLALAVISAAAMAFLYYMSGDVARVYYGTDTRAHALLLGSALGMIPEERLRVSKGVAGALFAFCAAGMLALMAVLDGAWSGAFYGLIALSAVLSGGLIALCADQELPFGRVLGWKPLVWLGQRSYVIYLCMYPVLYLMERLRPVDNPIILHLLEGGLILVLASAVHAVSVPRAWLAPAGQPGWKCFKRPALWAAVLALTAGMLTAAAAPSAPDDLGALERMLSENRRQIEAAEQKSAPTPTPELEAEPTVDPTRVTMVGDSVMLGALNSLQEKIPGCVVDAAVSRQLWDAYGVFDTLESGGKLGDVVILALGTNGPFAPSDGQGLIDRLGPERQIYWVTAYGSHLSWQEQSNESIRTVAAQNDNVTVVDWAALASGHGDWLYSDGIHLQGGGQSAYARMIADAIGWAPQGDAVPVVVWDDQQGILLTDP